MRLLPVFVFVGMIMVGNAPQAFSQVADVEVVIGPQATVPTADAKSQLDTPFAIEFDDQDAMIIVEYDGGRILRWHPGQDLVTLAGNAQPGYVDGPAAMLGSINYTTWQSLMMVRWCSPITSTTLFGSLIPIKTLSLPLRETGALDRRLPAWTPPPQRSTNRFAFR